MAQIREANSQDFDGVAAVFTDELQFHSRLLPDRFRMADPIMTDAWYDEILTNANKKLLVAVFNDELVGLVLLEICSNPDDLIFQPRRYVYVDELAVLESLRGHGIGKQLMKAAHAWSMAQGIAEIELNVWEDNVNAIAFYERLGYRPFQKRLHIRLPQEK